MTGAFNPNPMVAATTPAIMLRIMTFPSLKERKGEIALAGNSG
jgi:hypothetical protein